MAGSLLLFQNDLRIEDHPALHAARTEADWVCPLFVWSPADEKPWAPGAASRWWLHHSLLALQERLAGRGAPLVIRSGDVSETVQAVAKETGAESVYWSARYEPHTAALQSDLRKDLQKRGLKVRIFPGRTLFDPSTLLNKSHEPFQVFTPFWRSCVARIEEAGLPPAIPTPRHLTDPPRRVRSQEVADLGLLPKIPWDAEFGPTWKPGEEGAHKRLRHLLGIAAQYHDLRNRPDLDGTSALSPHLHFGEITPRQIAQAVLDEFGVTPQEWSRLPEGPRVFLAEIGWREFAHAVLYHFPQTDRAPLKSKFEAFPWKYAQRPLRTWQRGLTGYPIVDAGMRQLWRTGWMHNRVRMIVGSFLTKDLLQSWQAGAEWFWDTLVDADLANNTLGWQWISGCGADASPYFRIFNPIMQGRRYDPEGSYIRQWVPELAKLPADVIHEPWTAAPEVLSGAGVVLGETYPQPMVDHAAARVAALEALAKMKEARD